MTTMRTPTLDEFKTWAREHHDLAITVCKAQALAECERERVDAYILPIFQRYGFHADLKLLHNGPDANRLLTTPKELYLSEDPRIPDYYAECDAAHRAHGFTGPDGHCPALSAEYLHTQAENALLEAAHDLLDVELSVLGGPERKKMLDLLLGACLKESQPNKPITPENSTHIH